LLPSAWLGLGREHLDTFVVSIKSILQQWKLNLHTPCRTSQENLIIG
jgi:hypothetical protein